MDQEQMGGQNIILIIRRLRVLTEQLRAIEHVSHPMVLERIQAIREEVQNLEFWTFSVGLSVFD